MSKSDVEHSTKLRQPGLGDGRGRTGGRGPISRSQAAYGLVRQRRHWAGAAWVDNLANGGGQKTLAGPLPVP